MSIHSILILLPITGALGISMGISVARAISRRKSQQNDKE